MQIVLLSAASLRRRLISSTQHQRTSDHIPKLMQGTFQRNHFFNDMPVKFVPPQDTGFTPGEAPAEAAQSSLPLTFWKIKVPQEAETSPLASVSLIISLKSVHNGVFFCKKNCQLSLNLIGKGHKIERITLKLILLKHLTESVSTKHVCFMFLCCLDVLCSLENK